MKRKIEAILLTGFILCIVAVMVVELIGNKFSLPPLASNRDAIDGLFKVILISTILIFIITQTLWGLFIFLYTGNKGITSEVNISNQKKVLGVLFLMGLTFIVILEGSATKIYGDLHKNYPTNAIVVEVVAQQFAWNFRLPGKDGKFGKRTPHLIKDSSGNYIGMDYTDPAAKDDIVIQDELYLPVNIPVILNITSRDVIHSFFLPHFRVKQDAVPGMTSTIWFTPTKEGEYEIVCAELCGLNHYSMRGKLYVVSMEKFNKWLEEQQK